MVLLQNSTIYCGDTLKNRRGLIRETLARSMLIGLDLHYNQGLFISIFALIALRKSLYQIANHL
jgi:hypothetical protein